MTARLVRSLTARSENSGLWVSETATSRMSARTRSGWRAASSMALGPPPEMA